MKHSPVQSRGLDASHLTSSVIFLDRYLSMMPRILSFIYDARVSASLMKFGPYYLIAL